MSDRLQLKKTLILIGFSFIDVENCRCAVSRRDGDSQGMMFRISTSKSQQ